MIPRAATERLVEQALAFIGERPARVVDVGTGSGAIAVAIAAAAPNVHVFATDTSAEAIAIAHANTRNKGLDGRVTVCQGDLLAPVPGAVDVVVANLPYLATAEAGRHPDLAREPADAVFAPGDGLDPYRRLLDVCAERLSADGAVFLQLHREVVAVTRARLPDLRARFEPQLAAA
jgi:release factor glutamine methyltransferase